jgi:TonB-linked SusC/RagA family outer membrane protein
MKKRLLKLTCLIMLLSGSVYAQKVTGKVTSAMDGAPMPGVSVLLKGTSTGSATDSDGTYSVSVPDGNGTLIFSFIGFLTKEVPIEGRSIVDVTLSEDATQLSEVVVTSLGITKEARKLGYSATTVDGKVLDQARTNNVVLALQGTVAGLTVRGTNGGPGGTAKLLLRGMPSMNSAGSPLYVINGIPMTNGQRGGSGEWGGADNGDGIGNLNPDDIETMTVLKGQSASALYGARASNGVIMITTKKGKKGDFSVDYNMNFIAEKPMNLTDFQYEYGQGLYGNKPANATDAQGSSRMSWGAKLDGSQVIQYDGKTYAYSAQKDNIKNFYRTGSSLTNTISVSKGGENGSFRLSVSNLDNKSIVPNSGIDRKTINLNIEQKITDKLTVNVVANYINEKSKNRSYLSDGPLNPNNGLFLASNIDQRILAPGYNTTTGVETRWGDDEYVTNPYFVIDKVKNDLGRQRLISMVSAKYQILDWLYAQARVGYDFTSDRSFSVTPWGTAYTQGFRGGLNGLGQSQSYELNTDALIGVSKKLAGGDIDLDALVGINGRINESEGFAVGGGPFIIPNVYSYDNVANFYRGYGYSKTGVNSAFYSLDFGYKGFLTVNTTGRWDDYSTLYSVSNPDKETSIFVPSVTSSLLFSELLDMPALSFGKLRASWAQTSGELNQPYQTSLYYGLQNSLGGIPLGTFPSGSPNFNLKPFVTTEIEIGTDLKFFEGKLGIDIAWYTRKTKNEIMNSNFSPTSGATSGVVGTGSTKNTGLELLLRGTPVKSSSFSWDIIVNFTSVKNEIIATDPNKSTLGLGSNRGSLGNAITAFVVGEAGPQIRAYDYKRVNGEIVVDAAGLPVRGDMVNLGSVLPKYYGGITNEVKYKSVALSFLIDYNFGNKVLSATEFYSIRRGLHKMTLVNRDEGIRTGVLENGTANTVNAPAQDYYRALAQNITMTSVVSGDFIKLRQLSLSYSLPQAMLTKTKFIRGAQISLVGRNLAIFMRKSDNIDPEATFGSNINYYGIEGTSLPSTRSYGVNLNLKF